MPAPRRNRPFRGATPPGVFQTIDLGSGRAEYIRRQSEKFPNRKYAIVDKKYVNTSDRAPVSGRRNISIYAERIEEAIEKLIATNLKTRHVNMDMPYPWKHIDRATQEKLFTFILDSLPLILLPGGRFYISTEDRGTANEMVEVATRRGFRAKRLPSRDEPAFKERTTTMRIAGVPIRRLVISLKPKRTPFRKKASS